MTTVELIPGVTIEYSDALATELEFQKINKIGSSRQAMHPDQILEARRLHDALAELSVLATKEHVESWLMPIIVACKHTYPSSEVSARRSITAGAMIDYPAAVFNDHTQRLYMRTYPFFPTAAEIAEIVAPFVSKVRDMKRSIEQLCVAAVPDETKRHLEFGKSKIVRIPIAGAVS